MNKSEKCNDREYHDFEELSLDTSFINLKCKSATVGGEVECLICGLTINLYGHLSVEIKGDDYENE